MLSLLGVVLAAEPKLDFEAYTLGNGLEVLLVEDRRVPLVSVELWYHVGAKNEVPGRSGFAHLFEHIMFQGSRNVPEDQYFTYLERIGAPLVNGTTDFDRTNYFETVPAEQVELALWLESDRMGFLLDTLTQERLDNQKGVVRKERQQSVENVPYGSPEEALVKALYPAPHPYFGYVIGTHEDLEAATLEDVRAFFRTWYVPNNATLALAGDFDKATLKPMIERYFGSIPAGPAPSQDAPKAAPLPKEVRLDVQDEVELARTYFAWVTPPSFAAGDAELQLAANVLADGKASRLVRELVLEQGIASEVVAYQYPLQLGSMFVVMIQGAPGKTPEELEAAAWPLLEDLRTTAPTAPELQRAQRSWQAGTLRQLEALGGFGGKTAVLQFYNHHLGDPGYLPKDFARFAAVSGEAIQQAAATWLAPERRLVMYVRPQGGGQ